MGALISISGPDPLASVTATMQFLATDEGQKVVEDLRTANRAIILWIGDLVEIVHRHHVPDAPKPA